MCCFAKLPEKMFRQLVFNPVNRLSYASFFRTLRIQQRLYFAVVEKEVATMLKMLLRSSFFR